MVQSSAKTVVRAVPHPAVILTTKPFNSPDELSELVDLHPALLRSAFAFDHILPLPTPSRAVLREAGNLYRFHPAFWYVLLGTETVRALGVRALSIQALPWHRSGPELCEWYESRERVVMATVPHPSPKNRWFKDLRCRRAAERFLRAAAGPAGGMAHKAFRARSLAPGGRL
jgi:hypothetical protein